MVHLITVRFARGFRIALHSRAASRRRRAVPCRTARRRVSRTRRRDARGIAAIHDNDIVPSPTDRRYYR